VSLNVVDAADARLIAGVRRIGWDAPPGLRESVAKVLADVRAGGDAALVDHARAIRIPVPMQDGAHALVPPEIADALRLAKERLSRLHERQRQADVSFVDEDGTRYAMRYRPLESVAAYVGPGSAAAAVVMNVVPARIAGVPRVIVLADPRSDGSVHPAVLFACSLCEVDELYAVGGVQAIAAAAFGTDSIARVEKIVGFASGAVAEAKRQVVGHCDIDGIDASPDVLVIADDGANSELVAGELLAQAERDVSARVAVVSESRPLLDAVAQLLDMLDVRTLTRGDVIEAVIARAAFLAHAATRDDVFAFVEAFGPERVSLQVRDAEPYLARLRNVGSVFVGELTPIVAGAYVAGTNALTLSNFIRSYCVLENSRERMEHDAHPLAALAEFEGLPESAQSARMRSGA
jgi:histidinol dehydrogenase